MRALVLSLFLLPFAATAQPLAEPGDIAIVGLNHDGSDAFAFVALADLPTGVEIRFTENGWRAVGEFRGTGEGTMTWTVADTVLAGTVVTFECANENPESSATASTGTIVSGSICGLSTGGDQILAYRGDASAPTFLYGVNNEGTGWQTDATSSNTSALPTGLVEGQTAVALSELDNYAYTGPTDGTAAELREAIGNPANWTGSDDRATATSFPTGFHLSGTPDPEPIATTVRFAESALRMSEGSAPTRLRASLSNVATEQVSVEVKVASGTATRDADYTLASTLLTFEVGSDTASVALVMIDDEVIEADETVMFQLENPSPGLDLGTPDVAALTILDNDDEGVSYETLFPGITGAALLDSLRRVYTPSTLGYNGARDEMFGFVWNDGGIVEGLYTGLTISVTPGASDARAVAFAQNFNTEHAWPQSQGAEDEPQRSNLFNLFPTQVDVNGDRGSLPFGEVDDAQTTTWYRLDAEQSTIPTSGIDEWSELGQGKFEPREHVKGDVARSQFYFYAMYTGVSNASFFATMKDDLLDWHRSDSVDANERLRHDRIQQVQGEANPFVLDSTLVRRAFFSGDIGGGDPTDTLVTMAQARQRGSGATVQVRGIVTRAMGDYTYFQDQTGGLVVRQTSGSFHDLVQSGDVAPGDSLEMEGVLSSFNNLLQINGADLHRFVIASRNHSLPAPAPLTVAQIADEGERYESVLIRVTNLAFEDAGTFAERTTYVATVAAAPIDVRIGNADDTAVDGMSIPATATFTGPLGQFSSGASNVGYQLLPIEAGDVVAVTTAIDDPTIPVAFALQGVHPNPASHTTTLRFTLPQSADVRVEMFDVTGRTVLSFTQEMVAVRDGAVTIDTSALPAGLYLYRVTADLPEGPRSATGRLVVMR